MSDRFLARFICQKKLYTYVNLLQTFNIRLPSKVRFSELIKSPSVRLIVFVERIYPSLSFILIDNNIFIFSRTIKIDYLHRLKSSYKKYLDSVIKTIPRVIFKVIKSQWIIYFHEIFRLFVDRLVGLKKKKKKKRRGKKRDRRVTGCSTFRREKKSTLW